MRRQYYNVLIIICDLIFTLIAWVLFFFLRKKILGEGMFVDYVTLAKGSFFVSSVWMFLYSVTGSYVNVFKKSRVKSISSLFVVSIIGSLFFFITLMLDDDVPQIEKYYSLLLTYFGVHFIVMMLQRICVLNYYKNLIASKKVFFNTLIIGTNDKAFDVYENLLKVNQSLGFKFIGCLRVFANSSNKLTDALRYFGDLDQLETIIRRGRIENVIVALEPSEHEVIADILSKLESYNVSVSIRPDMYHMLIGTVKVNHLMGVPLIEINQELMPIWQFVVKRSFDVVTSLLFFVLGFPLLLFVSISTKLSSSGPVFFKQIRIGKNQKPFYIYKFRSMYVNSENKGPALSSDNDPRITPWGKLMRKTRLDELPQFWNVLKGDMAIVGPRPERNHFIKRIEEQAPYYRRILKVKPGITSLGQVKYGYAENVEQMVDRLSFDIIYIENISLVMDIRILLMTVLIVIQGRGK